MNTHDEQRDEGNSSCLHVAQKIKVMCYGVGRAGKYQVCADMQIYKGEYGSIADTRRARTQGIFVWKALNKETVRRWR